MRDDILTLHMIESGDQFFRKDAALFDMFIAFVIRKHDVECDFIRTGVLGTDHFGQFFQLCHGLNLLTGNREQGYRIINVHQVIDRETAYRSERIVGRIERKREIAAGKYIDKDEVALDYQKFFITFKRFALSLPSRLVSMVSDQIRPTEARRVERELTEETKRILTAFTVAGSVPEDAEENKGGADGKAKAAPD